MPHPPSYRRILHKMGYYDYQQGLIYRHLGQQTGWDNHLRHCRNFILRAADLIQPSKITILGSGWLLELPLAELSERTGRICLVDIVHPPEVVSQINVLKNVEIIEADVTGGLIGNVWNLAGRKTFLNRLSSLDGLAIPEYNPVEDPGMVISLNILSQLETLPLKLLKAKSMIPDSVFMRFREEVQRKHVDFLKKHKSVLISDATEIFTDSSGTISEEQTLVTELPEGKMKEEWSWNFDLKGSDYNLKKSVMKVIGLVL